MAIELEDLDDIFGPPPPDDIRLARICAAAHELAAAIIQNAPASADRTASIRKVREAVHAADDAIRLKGKY